MPRMSRQEVLQNRMEEFTGRHARPHTVRPEFKFKPKTFRRILKRFDAQQALACAETPETFLIQKEQAA